MLGIAQILAWGSTYYLLAVLSRPIADETGWSLAWVTGGLSLGLLAAGIVSPRVGDAIAQRGGRPVLAVSAVLLAIGLAGLALSPALPLYLVSWVVLGAAMGAGLYDAAFACLGRLYGLRARTAIATLTLFGGFASTACWPLSALLLDQLGWRGACLAYAAIHLVIVLPLYLFALPNEPELPITRHKNGHPGAPSSDHGAADGWPVFVLLAMTVTLGSMVSAAISVHLLTILQARDIALGAAVALGALVGPAQVGARAIEMAIGRYHHPVWTLFAATALVALGIGALWANLPVLSVALVLYGAGLGIESIARGTLPLALYGQARYPSVMGRIAMPSLVAQAASPLAAAIAIDHIGTSGTVNILLVAAVIDFLLAALLVACLRWNGSLAPSRQSTVQQ